MVYIYYIGTCGNERVCYKVFNVQMTPRNDTFVNEEPLNMSQEIDLGSIMVHDALNLLVTDEAMAGLEPTTLDPTIPFLDNSTALPLIDFLNISDYDYENGSDVTESFFSEESIDFFNKTQPIFSNESVTESFFSEESSDFFDNTFFSNENVTKTSINVTESSSFFNKTQPILSNEYQAIDLGILLERLNFLNSNLQNVSASINVVNSNIRNMNYQKKYTFMRKMNELWPTL